MPFWVLLAIESIYLYAALGHALLLWLISIADQAMEMAVSSENGGNARQGRGGTTTDHK